MNLLVFVIDDFLYALAISVAVSGVLYLASQLLTRAPKIDNARPAGLGDFTFPTATEARPVPLVWGTVQILGPNVIWYGNLLPLPITTNIKYSIFKSSSVVVGFQYFLGIHLGLCRGPAEVRSITWGDTKVWDVTVDDPPTGSPVPSIQITRFLDLFGGNHNGNGGIAGEIDVLDGSLDQPIDPYLAQFQQAIAGTIRTPNYAGTAALVLKDFYVGNSPSVKPIAIEVRRIPNGLGLDPGIAALNGGNDASIPNVLYEVITDAQMGAVPTALIDVANFRAAAVTLAAERNGFSFLMDQTGTCEDVIHELERQMGGVLFLDPTVGLYRIKLLRADYDPSTLTEISKATNLVSIDKFSPGLWAETQNQLNLIFFDRQKNYVQSSAWAQDLANAKIQGGQTFTTGDNVKAQLTYPGVKDAILANEIAWRDLRLLSRPRAAATVTASRALWSVAQGDVVALTDPKIGALRLPMRVAKTEEDELKDGTIRLDLIEDAFATYPASGGAPPQTLWSNPSAGIQPFARYFVIEAPSALNTRNPDHLVPLQVENHVWVGAVPLGGAVGYFININHIDLVGAPDGVQLERSEVDSVIFNATLTNDLPQGPTAGGDVTISVISVTYRDALFRSLTTDANNAGVPIDLHHIGEELIHLVQIGDEFLLFQGIEAISTTDLVLHNVYRGVMDTVQPANHPAGEVVYFVQGLGGLDQPVNGYIFGGSLNVSNLEGHLDPSDPGGPRSGTYDVRLDAFSGFGDTAPGLTNRIVLQNRSSRPLPPAQVTLDGVLNGQSSNLEFTGTGDATGSTFSFVRRDSRGADVNGPHNEIAFTTEDASLFFSDFPTANNTLYTVSVYADPLGTNTFLFSLAPTHGPSFTILRDDILRWNHGIVPTTIGIQVHTTHEFPLGRTWDSLFDLVWISSIASSLSGQFQFGAVDKSTAPSNSSSSTYTADVTGTFSFALLTAGGMPGSGKVRYSKNGAAFADLLGVGVSSNTLALTVGDTLVLQHTCPTSGTERFLEMTAPTGGTSGFALLYTT